MMRSAYNRHLVWCGASNQRLGAAGSGNGDPAGAAAVPLGGFGFFGFSTVFRAALCGGPAGWSSATTGLGSIVVEAGVVKLPGIWITCTGTVAGWNLLSVYVTEKPLSGAVTATEQGVLQPGPRDVRASAPGGTESSWTCTVGGVDLKASKENEEQPARLAPATAITMTRRMINPSL
jgi:hypothetical protein